jgi:hypothetical protein
VAERARFTEVTPGDAKVPRGNRRFRHGGLRALLSGWLDKLTEHWG